MAYQSLYRRFRPRTFDSLLGQEHVTTILKNQIKNNNIAHAYLFCGTRGTGKTSAAKIFSRAVNCLESEDGNPCNECEVCKGILDDSIMDVVEMDAASNNSVEDVRELREKVKYPPSKGRYKVYIIDEVHMLSKGAFNALLKTLEEPPKHLLFILATTEPQKLPTTIQSRCQRFDFKRISVTDIVKNMKDICESLNINVEERGLNLIARNADGAMRDALSILDQCVSFTDGEVTYDDVLSILGTVNTDLIFDISDAIIDKNLSKALELVNDIVQNGKDVNQFIKDLIHHFRNLMIAKSTDNLNNIIDGSDEFINKLKDQANKVNLNDIIRNINILSEAENNSKWSSQPRVVLEVSIIKLADTKTDLSVDGLVSRINELEKLISSGNIRVSETAKTGEKTPEVKREISKTNSKKATPSKGEKVEAVDNQDNQNDITYDNDISFGKIENSWPDILNMIKGDRISIQALLKEGQIRTLNNKTLIISFDDGFAFHRDAVNKNENKEYVKNMINKYLKTNLDVKFVMDSEIDIQSGESTDTSGDENEDNDILVNKAKEIFGEDLVEVK